MDTQTQPAEATTSGSQATSTAEGQAPAPLTTASSPWEMKAAALGQNADLAVQCSDPQFTDQVKRVTFLALESLDDEGTESVRTNFRIEEEIVTTEGQKKAPGHVVRPFPRVLRPAADADAKERDRAAKDLRNLALDLQGVGLLPRGKDPTVRDIYGALARLEGKQADCKFTTVKGAKRDENGEFKTFQNFRFAPVGAREAGAVKAASAGDY
jgi:hypothetical protein